MRDEWILQWKLIYAILICSPNWLVFIWLIFNKIILHLYSIKAKLILQINCFIRKKVKGCAWSPYRTPGTWNSIPFILFHLVLQFETMANSNKKPAQLNSKKKIAKVPKIKLIKEDITTLSQKSKEVLKNIIVCTINKIHEGY